MTKKERDAEQAAHPVLARLPLRSERDVVSARLTALRLAEALGLDRREQTRMATAVSEIARNAQAHAGGGEIEFAVDAPAQPKRFIASVSDDGPGIGDLDAILSGERRFAPGFGTGLLSARRLSDQFEVLAKKPRGTLVRIGQHIPREIGAKLGREAIEALLSEPPRVHADPISVVYEQNRELILSLDDARERQDETARLNRELEDTNRGVVALYSELDERADQLRLVSELKSRFLSHMSHEFRTPLNSILALSRLLIDRVDGDLNAEQEKQVGYIRRSAQSLLELVNDLLDLAKVEAGRLDVKAETFSLDDLFAGLRGSMKPLMTNPAVDLVFGETAGLPAMYSDEAKVAQVLRNFISNALKFTEAGRVEISVGEESRGRIVFAVQDTGIGIPKESQSLIFEEFSQVQGRLQQGGTGLGLALSRRLATLLGGDVWLRSEVGVGSTFYLGLPLRWGEVPGPADDGAGQSQPRVLVVDDEEAFRYVVRHIAQDGGFAVAEAIDGQEGLASIAARRPDVVVLDLQMPRMDGYAMLAAVTADAALKRLPVIICTSQSLSLDQKRALSAAYAIVPKQDISRDGLAALLHAALSRREGSHV